MRALCLSESMELHRVSLRFEFMIVRLVSEGDALALKLLQPLAVDLDAVGSGSRGVVPKDSGADLPLTYKDTQRAFVNRKTRNFSKKLGSPVMRQSFPAFCVAFSVALIPPFWRCRRSDRSPPSSAHRCIGGRAGFDLARPVLQWLPADFQAGGS